MTIKMTLKRAAEDIDKVIGSIILNNVARATEEIVLDLQDEGPTWTGEFGNSWRIRTEKSFSKFDGGTGKPRPVKAPWISMSEVRGALEKGNFAYTIQNNSPTAKYAMDLVEGRFRRPFNAQKPIPTAKWRSSTGGGSRAGVMKRGVTNAFGKGSASSTAELDWFTTYKGGGKLRKRLEKRTKLIDFNLF